MKKIKIISLLLLMVFSLTLLSSCCDQEKPSENETEAQPVTEAKNTLTGIRLNYQEYTFTEEGTVQLTVITEPEDVTDVAYSWLSGNPAVASVNANGLVEAKKSGSSEITVVTSDGSFSAKCIITVDIPAPVIEVTSFTLNMDSATIEVGESIALVYTAFPADATNPTVSWSSSDEAVAVVDEDGIVTGKKAGTATVTITEANGVFANAVITVKKATTQEPTESTVDANGLSFGQNPKYPSPVLDSKGFLSSDILSKYHEYNEDVVAWIYVPGTNINFPVAQRDTRDDFYLDKGLDKKSKNTGSCYLDERSTAVKQYGELLNHNNIFYGHAKGYDIFDQLENVTRTDAWFNTKSNRYVYINTLNYRYKFEIFATYYLSTADASVIQNVDFVIKGKTLQQYLTDLYSAGKYDEAKLATSGDLRYKLTNLKNTSTFLSYCDGWSSKANTEYSENGVNYGYLKYRDFGVTVDPDDVIVTLYTCADSGTIMKYIVQATLVAAEPR